MYIPSPPRDPRHHLSSAAAAGAARWALRPDPGAGPTHSTAAERPSSRFLTHPDPDEVAAYPKPTSRTLPSIAGVLNQLSSVDNRISSLRKRGSSIQNTNITIGVTVGILLAAFLVAVFLFCHRYRFSIRFTRKKKRHRRKSGSSKSSKASSDGGAAPAEAPPPPAG